MNTNKPLHLFSTKALKSDLLDQTVLLNGWIKKIIKVSKVAFVTLSDSFGTCQLVALASNSAVWTNLSVLTKESVVQVTGTVKQKVAKSPTAPAQLEIIITTLKIINLAKTTPFLIKDVTDGSEHLRLQYRYLDLRRDKMQNILKERYRLYQSIRDFFAQDERFVEVETPILAKPTVEGAQNFLVTSQTQKKSIFALPQSPQIYKQLLMNGGLSAYFQFARCFRDEDMRNDRQPEFTQLDLEINFANQATIIDHLEKMLVSVFAKIKGVQLKTPFPQLDYQTVLDRYGTDAPDLRYQLFLEDFSPLTDVITGPVLTVKGICFDQRLTNPDWKWIQTEVHKITTKSLFFYFPNPQQLQTNLTPRQQNHLKQHQLYRSGKQWIGFEDTLANVNLVLGKVRIYLAKVLGLTKNDTTFNFCWIVNYPMFEFSPTENKYVSAHHPFCQPKDVDQFHKNWKNTLATAYDLVCNGSEIGSGSERIYDLSLQKKVFQILGFNEEQMHQEFGYFLQAMEYGFPNHAGFGLGLDRLLMVLTNAESVRDVIAFPKTSKTTSLLGSGKSS